MANGITEWMNYDVTNGIYAVQGKRAVQSISEKMLERVDLNDGTDFLINKSSSSMALHGQRCANSLILQQTPINDSCKFNIEHFNGHSYYEIDDACYTAYAVDNDGKHNSHSHYFYFTKCV